MIKRFLERMFGIDKINTTILLHTLALSCVEKSQNHNDNAQRAIKNAAEMSEELLYFIKEESAKADAYLECVRLIEAGIYSHKTQ